MTPPTGACPQSRGAHPHAEGVTARPNYHQVGWIDEARTGAGGGIRWPERVRPAGSRIRDRGPCNRFSLGGAEEGT